jgi:hypothetical protein
VKTWLSRLVCAATLAIASHGAAATADAILTPPEHRRGAEQTFLTFPEWFLVHSPAEYAALVRTRDPDEFPFWAHIGQFWTSYERVYEETRRGGYDLNPGYHLMIVVIGASTTIEYVVRSAYETVVGRLSALTRSHGMTGEDRLAAEVAQDYVDFIRVQPWYEYDFAARLRQVWTRTGFLGPDAIRKWERKYALTTEYGIKALYGWLIRKATKATYEDPLPVTAVVVDRVPDGIEAALPDLKVQRLPDAGALLLVPRYEAFMKHASALARRGAGFREIAGNRGDILVSALVPTSWRPALGERVLFVQPIVTRPGEQRVALVVAVASLAATLNRLDAPGLHLEHVYDY